MNTPSFRAPAIRVPGLMTDQALQEQLKLYTSEQNATQKAAPPPTSAVEFSDRIQSEYLSSRHAGRVAGALAPAPLKPLMAALNAGTSLGGARSTPSVDTQQRGVDVRSDILSEAAKGLGGTTADSSFLDTVGSVGLRNLILGPLVGQLGEGGGLDAIGSLTSPEDRQAEADTRAEQSAQWEVAAQNKADVRAKLRGLTDADAARMGMPVPPGGADEETRNELDRQDARITAKAEADAATAEKARVDPKQQPTQTWWLDAAQRAASSFYDVPISAMKAPAIAWEAARDAIGLGDGERSDIRAWVDTVDATLNKMLPGDKARSKDFVSQLAAGGGSMVGYLLGGYIATTIGLPASAGTTLLGAASGATQQFEDAERHDGVGLQKYLAFVLGAGLGATEAIPLNRMLMRAEKATGGLVTRMLRNTVAGSLEEVIQEFGQNVGTDIVAKWLYDESREFDIGQYVRQGAIGAIVGGATALGTSVAAEAGVLPDSQGADRETVVAQAIEYVQRQFDAMEGMQQADGEAQSEGLLGAVEPAPDRAAQLRDVMLTDLPPQGSSLEVLRAAVSERTAARKELADLLTAEGSSVRLAQDGGRTAVAGPDMSKPGGFRLTRFDADGPSGHTEYGTLRDAVDAALQERYLPPAAKRPSALPSSSSLNTPRVPTAEEMKAFSRPESVPLSAIVGTNKLDWKSFESGKHPDPLIKGYEKTPVAVRKEDGEFVIVDGHHRAALAIERGDVDMPMQVIDAKQYDPANAGRKPAPEDMTADQLLGELQAMAGGTVEPAPVDRGQVFETPEFKNWFGDSKVVDEAGKPLVVYHGSPTASSIKAFDPARTGRDAGFYGQGHYFSADREVADSYTYDEETDTAGSVVPAYISLKKPFMWDATSPETRADTSKRLAALGVKRAPEDITGADSDSLANSDERRKFNTAARAAGYDGVIVKSAYGEGTPKEIVAFEPTQIKSAFNGGDFDPSNPDIMAMAGGTSSGRGSYKGEQKRPDAGISQQNAAAQQGETSDLNLANISRNLIRLLNLTARQGRFTLKGSSIMGQYSSKQDVVRVRTWGDLSTMVHEAGHALQADAIGELSAFIKGHEAELMKVATALYGGDTNAMPRNEHIAEGFAEFFRIYTLNRRFAEANYPTLATAFDAALERGAPQTKQGLDLIGQQFAAWLQLPSAQLVSNMIVSGQQTVGINAAIKELRDAGFPTWMHEMARNNLEWAINRYAGVNDLVTQILNHGQKNQGKALDVKRADDPRVLIRLAQNVGARAMVQTTDGVMGYRSVNTVSRGLREAVLRYHGKGGDQQLNAIDPQRQKDFAAYLVALRGIDEYRRLDEGKIERPPVAATKGDLQQTIADLDAVYGKDFMDAAEVVNEYGMALWKKSYDAGLISKETYRDGLDRQFYAPLQRDMSDKRDAFGASALTGGAQARNIVKRFRGSDRNIVDPMDVLMHKTFALERAIMENDIKLTLARLADKAGTAGALVERIPASQLIGKQFSVQEVARQLTQDPNMTEMDAADLMNMLQGSIDSDGTISLFRADQASSKGENILFFWEQGKVAAIQLADGELGRDVINTINGVGKENLPLFVDLIAATSTAFRASITSWPDFLIVNFIRDQMSAFILNDVGYKPFVTGLQGVGDELRQSDWARQYNAAMGIMGGMNVAALHKARIEQDIGALRKKGYLAKAFGEPGALGKIEGLARVVELTETGTRLGLFRKAYERAQRDGLNEWESAIEASYTATDYMDFGLNGSRMTAARRLIPFLNAQLQGLYKMMRTLGGDEVRQRKGLNFALRAYFKNINNLDLSRTEKQALQTGRKAWVKMAGLGLISAALQFIFEDDPDYQDASEYMRTTGWVIPMGDGRIFYIPKPFELALLANFTERAIESASGDPEAKNRFLRGLAMTLTPPTSPPAIQIAIEQTANYDFFGGREIVPDYMRGLEPELQYNNYTTELAKQIGAATGMSPMRVDHVLSGLGASAYRDISAAYNSTDPNRPLMDTTDVPIVRRFVRDARRGSTSSQDFWKYASTVDGLLRRAEVTYRNYLEAGNETAANAYLDTLDADEKSYALLNAHFKAEAKRLNPFYRNRQIATVVSALRREMVSELGVDDTSTKYSEPFKLTAREKRDADKVLSEIVRRETRNTLVMTKTPGWAGRKPLDVEKSFEMLGAVEPRVLEELNRRLKKAQVNSADTVREYWPEVKDRLLMDRENTFLTDILTIAKATR